MSATNWNLQWPYVNNNPLPVVNNTVPDPTGRLTALNQQRQATAQDTGNSWSSTPATGALAGPGPLYIQPDGSTGHTPPGGANPAGTGGGWQGAAPAVAAAQGNQGGNAFGYSYSSPGAGFNPWGLYDGGRGYQGGDGVGLYDPAKDTAKGWGPNGQTETDRDRVWRMTLGDLKAKGLDPGSAPPDVVQAAFLNNVARLHRDYDNTQGLGAAAWASSPFAAYDRHPAGGTGSQAGTTTQQGGTRGQGGTGQATAQTGGSTMPAPLAIDPTAGSSVLPGGGSVLPPGTTNPTPTPTTTTPGLPGVYGGAGGINMMDPMAAVRQYMQSHGMNPDSNGYLSGSIQKMMQALIPTIMKLTLDANGKPAYDRLSNMNSILDPLFYGGAGTMAGNLRNFGQQVQGQFPHMDFAGMGVPDQEDMLRSLQALNTFGGNHYVSSAANNRLDQAINTARDQQFAGYQQGKDPGNVSLWDYIQHYAPGHGYVAPFGR